MVSFIKSIFVDLLFSGFNWVKIALGESYYL